MGAERELPDVPALIAQLEGTESEAEAAIAALVDLGTDAVDQLLTALTHEDWFVRSGAALALEGIADPRSAVSLVRALGDPEPQVRHAASNALRRLGRTAFPVLLQGLRDQDLHVRLGAVDALGEFGDSDAIAPLRSLLADDEPAVRLAAGEALCLLGEEQGCSALVMMTRDPDVSVRMAAVFRLETVSEAVPSLRIGILETVVGALTDNDPSVREAAARTVLRIGRRVVGETFALSQANFPDVLESGLLSASVERGDPVQLTDAYTASSHLVRAAAARADLDMTSSDTDRLLILLRDPHWYPRACAAATLGRLRVRAAEPELRHLLRDPHPAVRKASRDALAALGATQS